jgi:hypothetical protein
VLGTSPHADEDDAARVARGTPYGLAVTLGTHSEYWQWPAPEVGRSTSQGRVHPLTPLRGRKHSDSRPRWARWASRGSLLKAIRL